MKIKIEQNIGKFVDTSAYIKLEEDIEFEIVNYQFHENTDVYFVADNGKEKVKGLVKDNKFKIERNFIKIGRLKIKFDVYHDTIKTNTIVVDNLIVKEIDTEIVAIPEIVEMQRLIKENNELVNTLSNKFDALMRLINVEYEVKDETEYD